MNANELIGLGFSGLCFFAFSVLLGHGINLLIMMGSDHEDITSFSVVMLLGLGFYGYMAIKGFKYYLKEHDKRIYKEWEEECTLL